MSPLFISVMYGIACTCTKAFPIDYLIDIVSISYIIVCVCVLANYLN